MSNNKNKRFLENSFLLELGNDEEVEIFFS